MLAVNPSVPVKTDPSKSEVTGTRRETPKKTLAIWKWASSFCFCVLAARTRRSIFFLSSSPNMLLRVVELGELRESFSLRESVLCSGCWSE